MAEQDVISEEVEEKILNLIEECGGNRKSFESDLIFQQIQSSLRLLTEGHNTGQLKLITRAMKEMRYAYSIFNKYGGIRRISIFGSARTPETDPDYKAAEAFSKEICSHGWMCITGAAEGIMKAGMAGTTTNGNFGLSIRLPFEAPSNTIIEGDPKLIHFRYFFTRKLMFTSHSDAIAVFPGGFGTLDELFEMLTLIQTGKSNIVPIVLMEGSDKSYWDHWKEYIDKNLLNKRMISAEDMSLFHIAKTPKEGVEHIIRFYKRYHSSRFVKDLFVIRLKTPITPEQVEKINQDYSRLLKSGQFKLMPALEEERELQDLPRLVFHFNRKDTGRLRQLIDYLNAVE